MRYADDWPLGFAGPKHEAQEIKSKIAQFLLDELKLELSPSKTLITHASTTAAHFLGYEIRAQHADTKITRGRRAVNGAIGLFVPRPVIKQRCQLYLKNGKPAQRGVLLHDEDFTIAREVSGRVPRAGPVLPPRPGRVPGRSPLGHGNLAAQNPGR